MTWISASSPRRARVDAVMRLEIVPEGRCRARVLMMSCGRCVCRMPVGTRLPLLGGTVESYSTVFGKYPGGDAENPCRISLLRVGLLSTHPDRRRFRVR